MSLPLNTHHTPPFNTHRSLTPSLSYTAVIFPRSLVEEKAAHTAS